MTQTLQTWMAAQKVYNHAEEDPSDNGAIRIVKGKRRKRKRMDPKKFNRLKGPNDYYTTPFDSITDADRRQAEV